MLQPTTSNSAPSSSTASVSTADLPKNQPFNDNKTPAYTQIANTPNSETSSPQNFDISPNSAQALEQAAQQKGAASTASA